MVKEVRVRGQIDGLAQPSLHALEGRGPMWASECFPECSKKAYRYLFKMVPVETPS